MQLTEPVKFPKFRERISLYSVSETADTYGGFAAPVETLIGSAWASIEKISGGEYWRASGVATEADWVITTWYRSDITLNPKVVIRLGTRVWDIVDINDVENKHQYIVVSCKERRGS